MRKRDSYGHLIHVSDRGLGGFGISLAYSGDGDERTPEFTFFHESDGFRQSLFSVDCPLGGPPRANSIFYDRLTEVLAGLQGGQKMVLEFRWDPMLERSRLACPPDLGGCGTMCTHEEPIGEDWTCPQCRRVWNAHDAQLALNDLEERASRAKNAAPVDGGKE